MTLCGWKIFTKQQHSNNDRKFDNGGGGGDSSSSILPNLKVPDDDGSILLVANKQRKKPNKFQKYFSKNLLMKFQLTRQRNLQKSTTSLSVMKSINDDFEDNFDDFELKDYLPVNDDSIENHTEHRNEKSSNQNAGNLIENVDDADGNPRNKCALKPGHSLMDWVRLGNSGVDLTGTRGQIIPVNNAELAKHCRLDDAWIAIRGKVFNVTKYMDFHPGGPDELLKGIGRDATQMFDDVHAWVNYEQLLSKCFVGPLRNTVIVDLEPIRPRQKATTPTPDSLGIINAADGNSFNFKTPNLPIRLSNSEKTSPVKMNSNRLEEDESTNKLEEDGSVMAKPKTQIIPRFDWLQKTAELALIFYTKPFCNPGVIVSYKCANQIHIRILIDQQTHLCEFQFQRDISWPCTIRIARETGKIEIKCGKMKPELWTAYGTMNRQSNRTQYDEPDVNNCDDNDDVDYYYAFEIEQCKHINHDSYGISLKPQNCNIIVTPIGYHVSVTALIDGEYVCRSYTPVPVNYMPFICSSSNSSSSSNIYMLIKSYTAGLLAKYLTNLDINVKHTLKLSTPKGNFQLSKLLEHSNFGLLAAGSGITPILGVLDHLLARLNNKIERIELLLFNKTVEDIWCRDKLETIQQKDNRLVIRHILSDTLDDDNWTGEIGRISENLLKSFRNHSSTTPTHNSNNITFCCVCGPTPFNDISLKLLTDLGYTTSELHFFQG